MGTDREELERQWDVFLEDAVPLAYRIAAGMLGEGGEAERAVEEGLSLAYENVLVTDIDRCHWEALSIRIVRQATMRLWFTTHHTPHHHDDLVSRAERMLAVRPEPRMAAEDVVQSGYLSLLSGTRALAHSLQTQVGWWHVSVRNWTRDWMRGEDGTTEIKRRRLSLDATPILEVPDARPDIHELAVRGEVARAVRAAVARLSDEQRAVVESRELGEEYLDIRTLAARLGVGEDAIKMRRRRAFRRLALDPDLREWAS